MQTKFFCSWTRVDPEFQIYDDEANLLLSPTILSKNWDVTKWSKLPARLYIDSGIYSNVKSRPTEKSILAEQLRISQNLSEIPVYYSHPDILIPTGTDYRAADFLIRENLKRASIFLRLFKEKSVNGIPVGVIHGFDYETIYLTYQELIKMGYEYFAIGSLSVRINYERTLVIEILNFLIRAGIKPIHVLGITLPLLNEIKSNAFSSFDTAAPIKIAHNGSVLYSPPLKRYIIRPNSLDSLRAKVYSFRIPIPDPLECRCPVCIEDKEQLVGDNNALIRNKRSLHNYFILKWETEKRINVESFPDKN